MCIILDTNEFGEFKKRDKGKKDEDMKPIWSWLDGEHGKIVYSPTEKIKGEWLRGGMKNHMRTLNQAGKLKLVPAEDVQAKANVLGQTRALKSNDAHIIALALIARVKVLVSNDKTLHTDFRNIVGGEVYMTKDHSHLLRRDTCP